MPNKSDKKKGLTTSHKLLSEDYKQQTEAIRSSEARFRTMVDSLPFDVFLIGSDGRYVLQNAPCRNSWGDIIGKRPEDICKDKKTLALWKSNNRRAFKGETVEEEVSFKVKDEEKHYYNIISPIREKGKITGILGINVDITKRKQAEEALKRLNDELEQRVAERTTESQRYQLAFQNAQDVIFWADPYTGVLVNCNKAAERVLEKSRNEIIGKHVTMLHPAQEKERYKAMFTEHVTKGGIQSDEAIIVTRSGKRVPVHISSSVISVGDTTVIQSIFTDITERKKTEEELRLNNEMFKNVAEGIYLIGLDDGIIKWANARFEKMFGYEPGEMIGRYVSMVNAPTDKTPEETKREIVDILRKTGEWHGKVNNIKKDGTPFWCYANVSVFDHPEYGKVFVSVHTDITEHKKAEEQILSEKKKLYAAIDGSVDIIGITDLEGNVKVVNKAFTKITGYEPKEIIGKRLTKVQMKKDAPNVLNAFKEVIEKGFCNTFDLDFLSKDGRIINTLAAGVLLRDEQGRPSDTFLTAKDVTERKKTKKRLEDSERKYRELVEDISDAIYSVDTKGNVDYISPAIKSLIGYEPHEMIGKHFSDFVHSEDLKEMKKGFESSLAGKTAPSVYRILNKAGSYTWIRALSKTIKDNKNNVIGIRGVVSDITERKKAEDALVWEKQRLEDVTSSVGCGLLLLDAQCRITYANRVAEEWFGPFRQIREKLCYEVFGQDEKECAGLKALQTGEIAQSEIFTNVVSGEEKSFYVVASPLKDSDGKVNQITEVILDITDRKKSEEQLIQAEQRYRTVADFTYDWEWWQSREGKYIYMSPSCERITGYKWDEFTNNPHLVLQRNMGSRI